MHAGRAPTRAGVGGQAQAVALQGLAVAVTAALLGTAVLWLAGRPGEEPGAVDAPAALLPDEPVVVHVAGQVGRPGVYTLPAGARMADALAAAGGPLADAALDAINLARVLGDGEQLYVPGIDDLDGAGGGARRPDGRLDLNRASVDELQSLPGIGPVLAERIVGYREQHGRFGVVGDLRRVSGIGDRLYRSLVELVAV